MAFFELKHTEGLLIFQGIAWYVLGLGQVPGYPRFGLGRPITRVKIYYPLPEC